jgi:hypothetical protein
METAKSTLKSAKDQASNQFDKAKDSMKRSDPVSGGVGSSNMSGSIQKAKDLVQDKTSGIT